MALLARQGHRVVLVVATGGELGEVPEDLGQGETIVDRRRAETERSAAILGVATIHWLGYRDSGMAGWKENDDPTCFYRTDVDVAAQRLADLLTAEGADVVVVYDDHGNYGHPDHIQVHHVGHRAARLAGVETVYEVTINRDAALRLMRAGVEAGNMAAADFEEFEQDELFGTPEALLTTSVDVSAFVALKRQSLACHSSQRTDSEFFLNFPPEQFAAVFSTEWYMRAGFPPGITEHALAGL
jgi:LmbE family N-acetylglucosaminyl deacetylase